MVAIGTTWRAALVNDQPGPVLTRRAKTRPDAFAQAHRLLDDAEGRRWFNGETIGGADRHPQACYLGQHSPGTASVPDLRDLIA